MLVVIAGRRYREVAEVDGDGGFDADRVDAVLEASDAVAGSCTVREKEGVGAGAAIERLLPVPPSIRSSPAPPESRSSPPPPRS
jgi:hypothetical protein